MNGGTVRPRSTKDAHRSQDGHVLRFVATACFWAYLAVLTVATHVPRVDPAYLATVGRFSPLQPDKALHLAGYGILGGLAGVAFTSGWRAAAVVRLFVALACWAFGDEFTQPFFGRSAELLDWCHDVAGLAVGLTCAVVAVRWHASVRRAAVPTPRMTRSSP